MAKSPRQIVTALKRSMTGEDWQAAARLLRLVDADRDFSKDEEAVVTTIESITKQLGGERPLWVRVGRLLDAKGAAEFVVGRHGHPTRVRWNELLGELQEIVAEDGAAARPPAHMVEHFHELPGQRGEIFLNLPADLTTGEADHVCSFVKLALDRLRSRE